MPNILLHGASFLFKYGFKTNQAYKKYAQSIKNKIETYHCFLDDGFQIADTSWQMSDSLETRDLNLLSAIQ